MNPYIAVLALIIVLSFEFGMARKGKKHISKIEKAREGIVDAVSRRRSALDSRKAAKPGDHGTVASRREGDYL